MGKKKKRKNKHNVQKVKPKKSKKKNKENSKEVNPVLKIINGYSKAIKEDGFYTKAEIGPDETLNFNLSVEDSEGVEVLKVELDEDEGLFVDFLPYHANLLYICEEDMTLSRYADFLGNTSYFLSLMEQKYGLYLESLDDEEELFMPF